MDQEILATAFKMTIALAAVLFTFGIAVVIAKKISGKSKGFLKKNGKERLKPLEILAHQSLGPGKGIYLVRCLDKKILVGSTQQQINHLADIVELEDEEADDSFGSSLENKFEQRESLTGRLTDTLKNIARV